MKKIENKIELVFIFTVLILLFISIILIIKNNVYHGELDIYIPHYLKNISIEKIIFDPICELDLTREYFRGRELGNFFNYLDYKIIPLLFYIKIPNFISVTNYISISILIFIILMYTKKYNNKALNTTYLCLILLLTSPPILFSGTLYRANKIVASLGIALTILFIVIEQFNKKLNIKSCNWLMYFGIYATTILACGADEQGFIFSLLILIVLTYILIIFNKKILKELILVCFGLLTYLFYLKFIGPLLFENINGIKPLTVPVEKSELLNIQNYINSVGLFLRYIISLLGNIYYFGKYSTILYAVSILLFIVFLIKGNKYLNKIKILILFALIIFYFTLVLHVMTLKHHAIFWPDIFTYYSLPIIFIIFSFVLLSVNYLIYNNKIGSMYINLVIAGLIFFNAISISHYKHIFRQGHLQYFMSADRVIDAVNANRIDSELILQSLRLNLEVSGSRSDMNYGEHGVKSLRVYLNKDN
jgi:hypothetical protein